MSDAGAAEKSDFDLIIIGGGINGAGIARDAGLRGLRTLLLEAQDFGSGTSSWSTRLIHGGLRYLEYGEIPLVRESLRERKLLRRHAGHLVKPICMTIPVYRDARRGPLIIRLGMIAYDLLSLGKELPRHRMLSRKALLAAEPGIDSAGLRAGAQYFDAQVTFAERLVLENVLDAAASGVDVRNYSAATALRRSAGQHCVSFAAVDGREQQARAPVVVNAAGPWVDRVLGLCGTGFPRLMGGTKGSHVIVGAFEGAPRSAVYVEARADGRPIFIIPWNGQYLVGTTDIRVDADPSAVVASDEEIDYLLGEANAVFPSAKLTVSDLHYAYAGVRPLPYQEQGPESAITRRHIIREHEGDARGLVSIIGGKLTTYRSLAEQTVDAVCRQLGRAPGACPTRDRPLPGGSPGPSTAFATPQCLTPGGRRRIATIYGARAGALRSICEADPSLATCIDTENTVLAAEVIFAIRAEYAKTLTDIVYRRLMVGLAGRLPAPLTERIADLAGCEFGWDAASRNRQLDDLADWGRRLRRSDQ